MRLLIGGLLVSIGIGLHGMMPAQAQVTNARVSALVEALRQAAPQTDTADDGLYSDWQIQPDNIPRWSRSCIGRELTPQQFEARPATAREVVTCVMRDIFEEQYQASNGDERLAIRRAAAWWMTGNPARYDSGTTATYTQRVLDIYQQQTPIRTAQPASPPPSASPARPTAAARPPARLSIYDRYMRAGYRATDQRDYDTALLYFRRALDERPNDIYAGRAIRNVEGYRDSQQAAPPPASNTTRNAPASPLDGSPANRSTGSE